MNVNAEVVADSVLVTWDRISLPEITGYNVTYGSTKSDVMRNMTVMASDSSSNNNNNNNSNNNTESVMVNTLMTNEVYIFQVEAIGETEGEGSVVIGSQKSYITKLSIVAIFSTGKIKN